MNHVEFAVVFVAGLVTALLLAVAAWRWQRRRVATLASRHAVQRAARAQGGELDAEGQLASAGYAILQRQAHALWVPRVDGVAEPFELRADFLVQDIESRDIFVAEVKTGDLAPELSTAATRRRSNRPRRLIAPRPTFHRAPRLAWVACWWPSPVPP
ncbi:MAG TPA: hypothetical protein PLF40_20820, partial [Kofleriaceae bacterium]|nr:hypothetical protein [Kofleriaceae bacterium]